jgi:hypothetical protein
MLTAETIRNRMEKVLGAELVAKLRGEPIGDDEVRMAGMLKTINAAASAARRYPLELHQSIYALLGGEGVPRDYFDFAIALKLMQELELVSGGSPTPAV